MPELPEVETIVRDLRSKVIGLIIQDFWCELQNTVKTHPLDKLASILKGRKIIGADRRAKYILIHLNDNKTLLIHQKMSGHLLYGRWRKNKDAGQLWLPDMDSKAASDPYNRFIRLILFLDNDKMLGLSDVRRFARVYLTDSDKIDQLHDIGRIGPEPMATNFNQEQFIECLRNKRGRIKQVLMNPYVIAGIGNIYADEILWHSDIHPLSRAEKLNKDQLLCIYTNMRSVLHSAIEHRGHSERDYRTLWGTKGSYQDIARVYQKHGQLCAKNDAGIIEKIRIQNRSAHFCPKHQRLYA